MTDYYVDPAATGDNDGSTWTHAWTSLQSALDSVTVGNTCYCRGTQVLTTSLIINTNGGSKTTGFIKFIGTNGSGVNDGTRFVVDGDDAANDCLSWTSAKDYIQFENFEYKNAVDDGVEGGANSCDGIVVINCISHNNGGDGWNAYYMYFGSQFIKCGAYLNGATGFGTPRAAAIVFCVARDNTQNGMILTYLTGCVYGCLVFDNGYNGIDDLSYASIINCTIDNNGRWGVDKRDGVDMPAFIGNRITNNDQVSYGGINCVSDSFVYGWNYFEDNTVNLSNDTYAEVVNDDGSDTNEADQADTNEGYTSLTEGSEDYNLRSDATLRRTAIQLLTGQ